MTTRTLDRSLRPWGADKRYKSFLGTYTKHPCGIWFPEHTRKATIARLVQNFAVVSEQLRRLAVEFELTVSFSPYPWTVSGNGSAMYAGWDQRNRRYWSPHIEFGSTSFQKYLLPHLTHELSHLWWRSRTEPEREQYRQFLERTTPGESLEVTSYCHGMFAEYVHYISNVDTTRSPDCRALVARQYRDNWTEESFCETVGKLTDGSYHKDDWRTTVNVDERRKAIHECTGLSV